MSHRSEFTRSILLAAKAYADSLAAGHVSHVEYGRAVAEQEGRSEAYAPDEVIQWFDGRVIPAFETSVAIAALAQCDEGPLLRQFLYGDEEAIHDATPEDYQRYFAPWRAYLESEHAKLR